MNLFVKVGGDGVSIYHCDEFGYLDATNAGNVAGQRLSDVIRERWGHPNRMIVEDCEFGTGYHYVTTHSDSAGYVGYRLHPLMSEDEIIAIHAESVEAAKANRPCPHPKLSTALAFDRLASI